MTRRTVAAASLMILGVMGSCAAADATETLLKNPSFEKPKDEANWFCDQAEQWGRWGNWINRETSWSPTHEGECLIGYHCWEIEGSDDSGIYQDVTGTQIGKLYEFSVYAYKDQDTTLDTVELRLEPPNGGQAVASKLYEARTIKSGEWVKLSVTGRTPEAGIRTLLIVKPRAASNKKGAIKFDDALLKALE